MFLHKLHLQNLPVSNDIYKSNSISFFLWANLLGILNLQKYQIYFAENGCGNLKRAIYLICDEYSNL